MRRRMTGIGTVLLALALLLTFAPACGNGGEDTDLTPTPPTSAITQYFVIEVIKPDNIKPLEWALVDVKVTCTLFGLMRPDEVRLGTIAVSFPDISNVENIVIDSSTLIENRIYAPGEEVGTNYAAVPTIIAQYPIIQGLQPGLTVWRRNEEKHIAFKVRPENWGTFTFYVKAHGLVCDDYGCSPVYEPLSGTKDQQKEYVEVHSFWVNEPIH